MLGGIGADGAVTVEGHLVGTLAGVAFEPERGASRAGEPRPARRGRAGGGAGNRPPPRRARQRGRRGLRSGAGRDGAVARPRGRRDHRRPAVLAARALVRRIRRRRRARARRRAGSRPYVAAEASRRLFVAQAAEGGGRRRAAQGPGARPRLSAGRAVRRHRPRESGDAASRPQPRRAANAQGPRRALRRLQPLSAGFADAGGADGRRGLRRAGAAGLAARRPTP